MLQLGEHRHFASYAKVTVCTCDTNDSQLFCELRDRGVLMPSTTADGPRDLAKDWAEGREGVDDQNRHPEDRNGPSLSLVVGRIVGRKGGGRCDLPPVDVGAAVALRHEFVFVRIRRDDHSAAGGQTENQSSIRGDANHSCARRPPSAWRRLRILLVKKRLRSPRSF